MTTNNNPGGGPGANYYGSNNSFRRQHITAAQGELRFQDSLQIPRSITRTSFRMYITNFLAHSPSREEVVKTLR